MTIEEAKQFLRSNGYFTDNLWHIDDVKMLFECDDETAQNVLDKALTNTATIEQIWEAIEYVADDKGLKRKDI